MRFMFFFLKELNKITLNQTESTEQSPIIDDIFQIYRNISKDKDIFDTLDKANNYIQNQQSLHFIFKHIYTKIKTNLIYLFNAYTKGYLMINNKTYVMELLHKFATLLISKAYTKSKEKYQMYFILYELTVKNIEVLKNK